MEIVIIWLALCVLAGWIASQKGRSGFGFFLLALFLSPLIGILAAFGARPRQEAATEPALTSEPLPKLWDEPAGEVAPSPDRATPVFLLLVLIGLVAFIVWVVVWGA